MEKMNSKDLNRWLGNRVYNTRIVRKLSQETLAELADLSRFSVSQIENGNQSAKIDTYYRIACALDVSLCELFKNDKNDVILSDVLLLLNDCSFDEVHAYTEILRTAKIQFRSMVK